MKSQQFSTLDPALANQKNYLTLKHEIAINFNLFDFYLIFAKRSPDEYFIKHMMKIHFEKKISFQKSFP